jgi:hypothetical protein
MLSHSLLSTSSVLAIVVVSMFPGMNPTLVGGDLPNCDTVKLEAIACTDRGYPECVGNIYWCFGCGEGKKIGLCKQSDNRACWGSVRCYELRHSKMVVQNQTGQVCIDTDCPSNQ